MKIFLDLTREGKIELRLETDKFHNNPDWVTSWVQKNIPGSSGIRGFSKIGGTAIIDDREQIISCLQAWQASDNGNLQQITRDPQPQVFMWQQASFNIPDLKTVGRLLASLDKLAGESISKEEFDTFTKNSSEELKSIKSARKVAGNQSSLESSTSEKIQKSSLDLFQEEHNRLFEKSKNSFLGGWRKTGIQPNWELSDYLKHAQEHNNRSRQAFINLGWMDKNGSLTEQAPKDLRDSSSKSEPRY